MSLKTQNSWKKFKSLNFNLALASTFSMVFSPIAHGLEIESNAYYVMKHSVKEIQYFQAQTKSKTMSSLWSEMKRYVTPKERIKIDQWMAYHGNQEVPKMELQEFKDKDGSKNVRLMLHFKEGSIPIVYHGDSKEFMKFGDVSLTAQDTEVIEHGQNKVRANQVIQKQVSAQKLFVDSVTPRMSYETWNKMTPRQRAEYLVYIRLMLDQSQKVFEEQYKTSSAGSSEKTYAYSMLLKIEGIMKALSGFEADAAKSAKTVKVSSAAAKIVGEPCVVAGYVASFDKGSDGRVYCNVTKTEGAEYVKLPQGRGLSINLGSRSFSGQSIPLTCSSSGEVKCNPYIYGASSGCVKMDSSDFKVASGHYSQSAGGCDSKIKLSTGDTFNKINALCAMDSKCSDNSEIKKILSEDSDLKKGTQNLVDDILKAHNTSINWEDKQGKISLEDFKKLDDLVFTPFFTEIDAAMKVCVNTYKVGSNTDVARQKDACEGLRARRLAMEFKMNELHGRIIDEALPIPPVVSVPPVDCTKSENAKDAKCTQAPAPVVCAGGTPAKEDGLCPPAEAGAAAPEKESKLCQGDQTKWCVGGAFVLGGLLGWLLKKNKKSKTEVTMNCMSPLVIGADGKCKPVVTCAGGVSANADGTCPGTCPNGTTRNAAGLCMGTGVCPTGATKAADGTCIYYATCPDGSKVLSSSQCPVICTSPLVNIGGSCVAKSEGGSGTNTSTSAGGVRGTK